MTAPQSVPPSTAASPLTPSRGLSPTHWLLIFAALAWSGLVCAGVCGGVLFFTGFRAVAGRGRPRIVLPGSSVPLFDGNDWMSQRQRAELYQTAVESVAGDAALQQPLGDDIHPSLESEELFERKSSDRTTEEIQFEVVGTQAKGTVTVRAARDPRLGFSEAKITVTLEDGTEFEVKPVQRPPVPVR